MFNRCGGSLLLLHGISAGCPFPYHPGYTRDTRGYRTGNQVREREKRYLIKEEGGRKKGWRWRRS